MAKSKRYQWGGNSAIKEMDICQTLSGEKRAVLYAPDAKDKAANEKIADAQMTLLGHYGLRSYPRYEDGRHSLVVYGFKKPEELLEKLQNTGYTFGTPKVSDAPARSDEIAPGLRNRMESFRHNGALKAQGIAGFLGNMALLARARLEDDPTKALIALIFFVNNWNYFHYGNGAEAMSPDETIAKTQKFLAHYGIDNTTTDLDKMLAKVKDHETVAKKLDQYVADNLIKINEGMGAVNNVLMIVNGLQRKEFGIAGAGLSSLVGSLVAMFAKEVPIEEQNPELQDSVIGKIQSWIQGSPMSFLGVCNLINSGSLYADIPKFYKTSKDKAMDFKKDRASNAPVERVPTADVIEQLTKEMDAARAELGNMRGTVDGAGKVSSDYKEVKNLLNTLEEEMDAARLSHKAANSGNIMWIMPTAMAIFYTAATILTLVSSKNALESDDPAIRYEELFSRAAQTALNVPKESRDEAIALMTAALDMDRDVKDVAPDEMAEIITTATKQIEHNPFIQQSGLKRHKETPSPVTKPGKNNVSKISTKPDMDAMPDHVVGSVQYRQGNTLSPGSATVGMT